MPAGSQSPCSAPSPAVATPASLRFEPDSENLIRSAGIGDQVGRNSDRMLRNERSGPPEQRSNHARNGDRVTAGISDRIWPEYAVTLIASPELQAFYRKLGWRRLTTGMIRPRSEEQARLNCPEEDH